MSIENRFEVKDLSAKVQFARYKAKDTRFIFQRERKDKEMMITASRCWLIAAWLGFFLAFLPAQTAEAGCLRVASWNVENLFDLSYDGTEYPGYIPGGSAGWRDRIFEIKLDNTSRVIAGLSPDVIGLQEVESKKALKKLQKRLACRGEKFDYAVIANDKSAAVKCALLSKYPVISHGEILVPGENRSILRVDLDITGSRLVVFVNHWKSKSGPESRRVAYARALCRQADKLSERTDYIMLGDFNSNYDEFRTILDRPSLNDTRGTTGVNHVIGTFANGELIDEKDLVESPGKQRHYNLWLELEKQRRWSSLFFGKPCSPDAILLPAALYDDNGISYVDNSFDKFDPAYLFDGDKLRRWQRADRGKGRHLGEGYSDHLPVYACFKTGPFKFSDTRPVCTDQIKKATIADLYKSKTGAVYFQLKDCAVIYRHGDNAVIKQKNGRSVYVYEAAEGLGKGRIYDITVSRLKRYYGNLEITEIESAEKTGRVKEPARYYIKDPDADLSDPALENEVIKGYCGIWEDGKFYYGSGKKIRLYFRDKSLEPEEKSRIRVRYARIGYHNTPEIVIEKPEQIKLMAP